VAGVLNGQPLGCAEQLSPLLKNETQQFALIIVRTPAFFKKQISLVTSSLISDL
jgi:hypothetical protein